MWYNYGNFYCKCDEGIICLSVLFRELSGGVRQQGRQNGVSFRSRVAELDVSGSGMPRYQGKGFVRTRKS